MKDCKFCNGQLIEFDFIGPGKKTMVTSLRLLFGKDTLEKPTRCQDGVQLRDGCILIFDNSSREYAPLGVQINYCPFCGEVLHENNQSEDDW